MPLVENSEMLLKQYDWMIPLFDHPITAVCALSGGGNSRTFKVTCQNQTRYLLKIHHQHPRRPQRLEQEFQSVQFLWEQGMRIVPKPVRLHAEQRCAVYEFVEGDTYPGISIETTDVDQAIDFLRQLHLLTGIPESQKLPDAAEACFSLEQLVQLINNRYEILTQAKRAHTLHQCMAAFLEQEWKPAFQEIVSHLPMNDNHPHDIGDEIAPWQKTLSPSDFGFHNAIRKPDGAWIFVDFEYFGWDDPAKLIVDFLLHPRMTLPRELKEHFLAAIFHLYAHDRELRQRTRLLYPLLGMKWCLILLNEFIPHHFNRRRFASSETLEPHQVLVMQLDKAKSMYTRMMSEYNNDPIKTCSFYNPSDIG